MSQDPGDPAGVIDTHLHLWDPRRLDYPWLAADPRLDQRYDLTRLGHPAGVAAAIMMQADCREQDAPAELAWVKDQAAADRLPLLGMVAFAPVDRVGDLADWLSGYAADPFVLGIRRLLHDEPAGGLEGFVAGARLVARAGLPFDACVRQRQLGELAAFAQELPELSIVVDHLGKPSLTGDADERRAAFADWRRAMAELARRPNVRLKLSGLGAEADPARPLAEQARPYLEAGLEAFGAYRCVVGSDWPVSVRGEPGWGYADWLSLLEGITATLSEDERAAVRHENAREVYLAARS